MSRLRQLIFCLAISGSFVPARAQTAAEFRPELGIYLQEADFIRMEFIDLASDNQRTREWQGNFAYYIDAALKPVLRRNLREHPDVYRDRYLTSRVGYLYRTGLNNGNSSSGNIGIVEVTSRYQVPWRFVLVDRNRGEFRFIKGQPFNTRYRNRFRVEHDIKRGRFVCTPYAYDEIFFDTRYGRWTPNRYALGVEVPASPHMVFDLYYIRQNGSFSNPPHLNIFGFKWNLYF